MFDEETVKNFGAWSATPCDPGIDGGAATLTAVLKDGRLVTIGFIGDRDVFAVVEDEDGGAVPGCNPLDLTVAPWSRNVLLAVVEAAAAAQGAPVAELANALDWIAMHRRWWFGRVCAICEGVDEGNTCCPPGSELVTAVAP